MPENSLPPWRHRVVLTEREELVVEGVNGLGRYNEQEIQLDSECGGMNIGGEGMQVRQLDLDAGRIVIDGRVRTIEYVQEKREPRRLLQRFFGGLR